MKKHINIILVFCMLLFTSCGKPDNYYSASGISLGMNADVVKESKMLKDDFRYVSLPDPNGEINIFGQAELKDNELEWSRFIIGTTTEEKIADAVVNSISGLHKSANEVTFQKVKKEFISRYGGNYKQLETKYSNVRIIAWGKAILDPNDHARMIPKREGRTILLKFDGRFEGTKKICFWISEEGDCFNLF